MQNKGFISVKRSEFGHFFMWDGAANSLDQEFMFGVPRTRSTSRNRDSFHLNSLSILTRKGTYASEYSYTPVLLLFPAGGCARRVACPKCASVAVQKAGAGAGCAGAL